MKSYDLFLHYKQGDDFHHVLKDEVTKRLRLSADEANKLKYQEVLEKADVAEAFRMWGEHFAACEQACRRLASIAKEYKVIVDAADTHAIYLALDPVVAAPLVKEGILSSDPEEDEEEDDDDDDDDDDPDDDDDEDTNS